MIQSAGTDMNYLSGLIGAVIFMLCCARVGKLLSKRGHFLLRRSLFSLQPASPSSGREEAQQQQQQQH